MGKSSWNDSSASLPLNWRDNKNGLGGPVANVER